MLQRMRTLAVQAASDTNTADDRTALNQEFTLLRTEINRIGNNTQWNGENVLDQSFASNTGAYSFQVGANAVKQSTCKLALTLRQAHPLLLPLLPYTQQLPVHRPAQQVSTVTIAGTPALGDTIAVTVGDKSYVHTVVAGDSSCSDR